MASQESLNHELLLACKKAEVVRIPALIESMADPNSTDEGGWTPLHWMAFDGQPKSVEALAKHGALVNPQTINGFTPMHVAAYSGHSECIEVLARHRAAVDPPSDSGDTPLHRAALRRQPGALRTLLSLGADTSLNNNRGEDALAVARSKKDNTECIQILKDADGEVLIKFAGNTGAAAATD